MIDALASGRDGPEAGADAELADLLARLAGIAAPDDHPHPQRELALLRLAALVEIQRAATVHIGLTAAEAAALGANYAQIGAACHMTRQGARRRWPGLVFARPHLPNRPTEGNAEMNGQLIRPYTVLLIEDDDADAMLIEEALMEYGMARTVRRAADGVKALEDLRSAEHPRPDLIVLDLNMPRMNGRELLTVLKNDPAFATIPTVVLTTSAAPDDINAAYREHANAYVTKPVNLDDFVQSVRSIDAFFLETATTPPPPDRTDA